MKEPGPDYHPLSALIGRSTVFRPELTSLLPVYDLARTRLAEYCGPVGIESTPKSCSHVSCPEKAARMDCIYKALFPAQIIPTNEFATIVTS